MVDDLLDDHDATGVAAAVAAGEVSAAEVLEACLRRIDERDPAINAVVDRRDHGARADVAAGLPAGPLQGVPFVVKDLGATVAGLRATDGSRLFADRVAPADSEIVARFRRAGVVIVATTNSPEFGRNASTEPVVHGATRNPYDLGRSAGGSSGGTAAAVASGMVPLGHGNDGGGSIRIPASACGLVGLKPSRARTPSAPNRTLFSYPMGVNLGLTRTVRDTALLLDVAAGPVAGDGFEVPPPARPYVEEVGADPGRLRIALCTTRPDGSPTNAECSAATEEAARLLESLGHHVEATEVDRAADAVGTVMRLLMSVPMAATVDAGLAELGRPLADDDLEPFTRLLYESARSATGADVVFALQELERAGHVVAASSAGFDLLLTPTIAEPAPPLGHLDTTVAESMFQRAGAYSAMTAFCNVTGQPAISLPLGRDGGGVPIGVQLVAAFGREDLLLRVAAQVEAARPWSTRPVWVPAS